MKHNERQIIIKEINKWRRGKLLPSEYCDFLLNLYSEGEIPEDLQSEANAGNFMRRRAFIKYTGIFVSSFLVIAFLILFAMKYAAFTPTMKITLLSVGVMLAYLTMVIYKYRGKQPILLSLLHTVASIVLASAFVHGIYVAGFAEHARVLLGGLTGVFLVWIGTSLWLQHKMVFIAGIAGLTLLYYNAVLPQVSNQSIFHYQMYWLPLFFIALWLAFSCTFKQERRPYSMIFLLVGVIYLFMPEVGYFLQNVSIEFFQYVIPVKLLVVAGVLIIGVNYIKFTEHEQMEV